MQKSESLDKFGADFAQAQAEMGGAVKDSDNPFFKKKYADLTSVWLACKEALHKYGFAVIQSPIDVDGRIGVETLLLHKSGQWVSDRFTLGVKKQNDPQADGSSITYARRYALAAFVGVCPVDDDAEGSMVRGGADNQKPAKGHILPEKQTKAELQPGTPAWGNAIAAFKRDGHYGAIEKRMAISDANKTAIKEEAANVA